jgi:NADH:ubiquinone oxidoreductase subunit 2 (subunit N)
LFDFSHQGNLKIVNNSFIKNRLYYESSKEIQYVHYPLMILEAVSRFIRNKIKLPNFVPEIIGVLCIALLAFIILYINNYDYHALNNVWLVTTVVLLIFSFSYYLLFAYEGLRYVAKSLILLHLGLILITISNPNLVSKDSYLINEILTITISFIGLLLVKQVLKKRFGKDFSFIHSGMYSVCPEAGLCAFICILSLTGFPGTIGSISSEFVIEHLMQTKIYLLIVPFTFTVLTWCAYRRYADSFYGRVTVANRDLFELNKFEKFSLNFVSATIVLFILFENL